MLLVYMMCCSMRCVGWGIGAAACTVLQRRHVLRHSGAAGVSVVVGAVMMLLDHWGVAPSIRVDVTETNEVWGATSSSGVGPHWSTTTTAVSRLTTSTYVSTRVLMIRRSPEGVV